MLLLPLVPSAATTANLAVTRSVTESDRARDGRGAAGSFDDPVSFTFLELDFTDDDELGRAFLALEDDDDDCEGLTTVNRC